MALHLSCMHVHGQSIEIDISIGDPGMQTHMPMWYKQVKLKFVCICMCIYQSWSKTMQHSCMSNSVATSRICHIWVLSPAIQRLTVTISHQSRSCRHFVVRMLHPCVPIDVRLGESS